MVCYKPRRRVLESVEATASRSQCRKASLVLIRQQKEHLTVLSHEVPTWNAPRRLDTSKSQWKIQRKTESWYSQEERSLPQDNNVYKPDVALERGSLTVEAGDIHELSMVQKGRK